jgi:hypothetical protein
MSKQPSRELRAKLAAIAQSGLSIYDRLDERADLFLDIDELREILNTKLIGLKLGSYPIRTRSKIFKSAVCTALSYPVPQSFEKTRPRFPGQDFDTYVQKSNNLQIWNEDVSPTRRYVIARCDAKGIITTVKIVTGETIAKLDRTGTLTRKYQASRKRSGTGSKLVSAYDTPNFRAKLAPSDSLAPSTLKQISPTDRPNKAQVLTVAAIYNRLKTLVGRTIENPGTDQERNRGVGLQRAVCDVLGLKEYADKGQHPDILSQALEVKLQTARTIDLGLVSPDGTDPAQEAGINHCDIRYAVVYGELVGTDVIKLTEVVVSTGEHFFQEFEKFAGKVVNAKRQLPLPANFFD